MMTFQQCAPRLRGWSWQLAQKGVAARERPLTYLARRKESDGLSALVREAPMKRKNVFQRQECVQLLSTGPPKQEEKKEEKKEEPAPTGKPSFKDMVARHGPVFMVYWSGLWLMTGGLVYGAITTAGPETAMQLVQKVGLDKILPLDNLDPRLGNAALAIAINEGLEIIRFPFVIATTPRITRLVERVSGRSMQRKPGKFATMIQEHGAFFLGYWLIAWGLTGVGCYVGINSFGTEAAIDLLRYVHLDSYMDLSRIDPTLGNVAVAVLINEMLEPIRLPLVIGTLPLVKRLFK